jgi:hypothetical protein
LVPGHDGGRGNARDGEADHRNERIERHAKVFLQGFGRTIALAVMPFTGSSFGPMYHKMKLPCGTFD